MAAERTGARLARPTPRALGYRWPAEWERHEATWLAWPHDPVTWADGLAEVEGVFALFAKAVGRGETVHVLARDAAVEARARLRLAEAGARRVRIHRVATHDAWIRDYGPIVVARGRGRTRERLALDFRFNAWGGKYPDLVPDDGVPRRIQGIHGLPTRRVDVVLEGGSIDGNGRGTLLTSAQCLKNPNRNPALLDTEIEQVLRETLGATHVLWLGEGIAGDDTDGHVDDVARFVGPRHVLVAQEDDPSDLNHAPLADDARRLRSMADQDGVPLEVGTLPMPDPLFGRDGRRLPASYANFYVANCTVVVPTFGGRKDEKALRTLRRAFPGRDVVGLCSTRVVEGLGALHCLSQQLPA